jgi:hypothetical protein
MAHKLWVVLLECRRAEDVIGVDVGHHHVFDRELGFPAYGGSQAFPVNAASARVEDRYCITADDEPDVGYGVFVFWGGVCVQAAPYMNSRRYFLHLQGPRLSSRGHTDAEIARTHH